MKRLSFVIVGLSAATYLLAAGPSSSSQPASSPASQPSSQPSGKQAQDKKAADECYARAETAYMQAKWDDLRAEFKEVPKLSKFMSPEQQKNINYMRITYPEYRPDWWKNTHNSSNISFEARIWGKKFMANYMPSEYLGAMMPVDVVNGRLRAIVTWQPSLIDNPKPANGELAKIQHITKGDIGEVIVWHELGHNYVCNFLPPDVCLKLYNDQRMLFDHIQEFYADMTALYHCTPRARRAALMLRLDSLDWYHDGEAHTRMAHGIGSMLLAEFLSAPEKWPSVHLPPDVAQDETERKTIIYVYEHMDPAWTLAEDKALRDLVEKFIHAKGEYVLTSKGEIPLCNMLSFKLMAGDDHDLQAKRDAWVAGKLNAAIQSGRADKADPKSKKKWTQAGRIEIPW